MARAGKLSFCKSKLFQLNNCVQAVYCYCYIEQCWLTTTIYTCHSLCVILLQPYSIMCVFLSSARLSGSADEDEEYEEIEAVLHSQKKVRWSMYCMCILHYLNVTCMYVLNACMCNDHVCGLISVAKIMRNCFCAIPVTIFLLTTFNYQVNCIDTSSYCALSNSTTKW